MLKTEHIIDKFVLTINVSLHISLNTSKEDFDISSVIISV